MIHPPLSISNSTTLVKLLLFIMFSSSIVVLHRNVTPPIMVLFHLEIWSIFHFFMDERTPPVCINSSTSIKITFLVIKKNRSSTIGHRMRKRSYSSMEFLPRDDLSKDDCPCTTRQGFHRAHLQISSARMTTSSP